MKKLILKMSVSVDGFVGGPNEESDWIFRTGSSESEKWEVATVRNASLETSEGVTRETSEGVRDERRGHE